MEQAVRTWFDKLTEGQREMLHELRDLVLSSDDNLTENLKWQQPCYSRNQLVCYLQKAKTHVTLGFQQGAHLSDPMNILEGSGKSMRHVKLALNRAFDREPLKALLVEAIAWDENNR